MALKKTKYQPINRTQKIGQTFEIINDTLSTAVGELESLRYSKTPVRLVTTQALPAFTATGNVLEANANGLLYVDSEAVELGDRILVCFEYRATTAPFNGIYDVKASGGSSSKWKLERSADSKLEEDFINGVMVLAVDGQKNKELFFSLSSDSVVAIKEWKEANPSISAIGNVPLSFAEVTFGGGGIMGSPVQLSELPPTDSKKYQLPYSGMYEMVWVDGILQIKGIHYDVADGVITFKAELGAFPKKNFNRVTASAALFIASSLKNAGGSFTSPIVVPVFKDPADGSLYAEVPGAGDDEIVWIDGGVLARGTEYTRALNRIVLKPEFVNLLKSDYKGTSNVTASPELLFSPTDSFAFDLVISAEKIPLIDTNAVKLNGVAGIEYVRKFQQGSVSFFESIDNLKSYSPTDVVSRPTSYSNGMLAAVKDKGIYRYDATSTAAASASTATGTETVVVPNKSVTDTTPKASSEPGRWHIIVSLKPDSAGNADKLKSGTTYYDGDAYLRKNTKEALTFAYSDTDSTPTVEAETGAVVALIHPDTKATRGIFVKNSSGTWDNFKFKAPLAEKVFFSGREITLATDATPDTIALRTTEGYLKAKFPEGTLGPAHVDTVVTLNNQGKIPSNVLTYASGTQPGIVQITTGGTSLLEIDPDGKLKSDLSRLKTVVDLATTANKPIAALNHASGPFSSVVAGSNIDLSVTSGALRITNTYTLPSDVVRTSTLSSYVTNSRLSSTLSGYVTNSNLSSTLNSYVSTIIGDGLDVFTSGTSRTIKWSPPPNMVTSVSANINSGIRETNIDVEGNGTRLIKLGVRAHPSFRGSCSIENSVRIGTSSVYPFVGYRIEGYSYNHIQFTFDNNELGYVALVGLRCKLTSTTGTDIAENVPIATGYATPEPGDLLEIFENYDESIVISEGYQYSLIVAGVCSSAPGILLGGASEAFSDEKHKVLALPAKTLESPVALAGRVPTKVTTKYIDENGNVVRRPIKRGYLLVSSSIPGHAMAADPSDKNGKIPPGTVIGKALQEWNPAEDEAQEGVIKVWVNLA